MRSCASIPRQAWPTAQKTNVTCKTTGLGVLVGALVGSVVVLLTTPESGEQLRAQIQERGQNFVTQIRSAADSRRIELRGRLESLRAPRAN